MPDGDYQSCNGCEFFVTCSNGITDNKPCPLGTDGRPLQWDDNTKFCERESQTCDGFGPQTTLPSPTGGSQLILKRIIIFVLKTGAPLTSQANYPS